MAKKEGEAEVREEYEALKKLWTQKKESEQPQKK